MLGLPASSIPSPLLHTLKTIISHLTQVSLLLGILVISQLLLEPLLIANQSDTLAYASPLFILINFAIYAYKLIRKSTFSLLTPIITFLGWSAAVFGLGPLYMWLAPTYAVRLNSRIFSLDPADYIQVSLLSSFGLLVTIFSCRFVIMQMYLRMIRYNISLHRLDYSEYIENHLFQPFLNPSKLLRIGYGLLMISFFYKAIELFFQDSLVAFGFLSVAGKAGLAGILILAFSAITQGRLHLLVALLYAILESFLGLATGMKSLAIMPIVALVFGYYLGTKSLKVLVVGVVGIILALILIAPVVFQIRQLTWSGEYGSGQIAAVGEAAAIANETSNNEDVLYNLWRRLDYSPWQQAMMYQYNSGRPGSTYRFIPWSFVPRFLFPNKPELTIGTEIGYFIQNFEQSSSFAGTVYGEMYWNGGWLAVFYSSVIYGSILGFMSIVTLWLFSQNTWPALLIGISGILYGFTVDTHFSVDAVGKAITFFMLVLLYRILAPLAGFKIIR